MKSIFDNYTAGDQCPGAQPAMLQTELLVHSGSAQLLSLIMHGATLHITHTNANVPCSSAPTCIARAMRSVAVQLGWSWSGAVEVVSDRVKAASR